MIKIYICTVLYKLFNSIFSNIAKKQKGSQSQVQCWIAKLILVESVGSQLPQTTAHHLLNGIEVRIVFDWKTCQRLHFQQQSSHFNRYSSLSHHHIPSISYCTKRKNWQKLCSIINRQLGDIVDLRELSAALHTVQSSYFASKNYPMCLLP